MIPTVKSVSSSEIKKIIPSFDQNYHFTFFFLKFRFFGVSQAMMMELEALDGKRLQALDHIMIQKKKVARAYNKRVKRKSF